MLTEVDLVKRKELVASLGVIDQKLERRVDNIIKVIETAFGKKHPGWQFPNPYDDGATGEFQDGELIGYQRYSYEKMETHVQDYTDEFPRAFLFMSDDEIKSTLEKEILETKAIEAEKIQKSLDQKAKKQVENEALLQSALAKLTPEEQALLKVKNVKKKGKRTSP